MIHRIVARSVLMLRQNVWAVAAAACSSGETAAAPRESSLRSEADLFFTLDAPSEANMQALFQGTVIRDSVGCLRLDASDRHTLVWPAGFTLRHDANGAHVLDAQEREIGRIGGSFRLGGGEVQELHAGIRLAPVIRELALQKCPGRFWIVGEVQ